MAEGRKTSGASGERATRRARGARTPAAPAGSGVGRLAASIARVAKRDGRLVPFDQTKIADAVAAALEAGIKMFNVESRQELRRIDAVAGSRGEVAPVAFRVNPDVDPQTHPHISTGLRTSKFGVPIADAVDAYAEAKALENVRVIGVDYHIGSQLTKLAPFGDALARVKNLVLELRDAGHAIDVIDVRLLHSSEELAGVG